MSLNYLRAQALTLQQQLGATPMNSPQWHSLRNELLTVQAQLRQVEGAIRGLAF